MSTFQEILDNTKNVTVSVPKTTSLLSFVYITVGDKTVRVGSMALLNSHLATPVFVPTEIPDFSKCAQCTFDKKRRYASTAILACTKALIAKTQGIGGRDCTKRR
jgi:hypothetical protein